MPVCQFCGLDSPGDARFCGVCGRPLTNGPDTSTGRSGENMQAPPPPPPPSVPQSSSISSPYGPGSGPSFTSAATSSLPGNVPPPPPPPGIFSGSDQPPTIRQSYPATSGTDAQQPTIRQSYLVLLVRRHLLYPPAINRRCFYRLVAMVVAVNLVLLR